jgi:hypothetical protein
MQEQNWRAVVEGVIELSGGASDGVRTASDVVEGDEAKRIEQEVSELIVSHRRRDHAG